jgi:hypothetical protein
MIRPNASEEGVREGVGASFGPGSHASHGAAEASPPIGFDPSRGLHILQHSLGVDQFGQGRQYRNHFVTGEGSDDHPTCCGLVAAGLMTRQNGNQITGGDDAFFVTDAGRRYVAENSPPPPKLTRGQARYRDWLSVSDITGETFIEFCKRRAAPSGDRP